MSFGKAPVQAARDNATSTRRRSAASQIESLLENRGVAPIAAKAISIGKEVGKGRFKRVHEGLLRQRCGQDRREVVVLWYAKKDSEVRELEILALLSEHSHSSHFVPEVFGVVDDRSAVTLVQERAAWGTLKSCLACSERSLQITVAHKLHTAAQISQAIVFLESLHIVHADLACRNVLLFELEEDPRKVVAKVTDFGLAIILKDGEQCEVLKQPQATRWCSPETVAYGHLSHQSDVWAFGALLWELFSAGATPWVRYDKRADVTEKLIELAEKGDAAAGDLSMDFPVFEDESSNAYDVMLSCLRVDTDARPKMGELENSLTKLFEEEICTLVADESFITTAAEVSAVADVDDILDDAASSGSTEASAVDLPWMRPPSPSKSDKSEKGASTTRFELVSQFLCSPDAALLLGPGRVQEMQRELEAASTSSMDLSSPFEYVENASQTCPDAAPIRELRLPRAGSVGPLRCWGAAPALCIWTLWSLADDDTLVRRDYASEKSARAAFEAEGRHLSLEKQELCQRSYFR